MYAKYMVLTIFLFTIFLFFLFFYYKEQFSESGLKRYSFCFVSIPPFTLKEIVVGTVVGIVEALYCTEH
jgi:hypothetical protein